MSLTLRRWLQAHSSSAPLPLSLPCGQNHAYKADAGNDEDEIYLYGQMAFGTRQAWQLTDSSLTLMDHVAEGKFATIYKAAWRHDGKQETVAAKMLKGESSRIFFFFF